MSYYLHILSLRNCPYSEEVEDIVKNNNINSNIIKIERSNKELYKTKDISTFPQIYFKKYNSKGSVLLGGNENLKNIMSVKGQNLNVQEKHLKKIYNFSRKTILRLIELINKK